MTGFTCAKKKSPGYGWIYRMGHRRPLSLTRSKASYPNQAPGDLSVYRYRTAQFTCTHTYVSKMGLVMCDKGNRGPVPPTPLDHPGPIPPAPLPAIPGEQLLTKSGGTS